MKYKITKKLFSYFTIVLLLFSFFLGGLFLLLFSKHSSEIYRSDLEKRASAIATTLSQFLQRSNGEAASHGMGGGYGAYIRFLDEIAMSDLWIVDEKAQSLNLGSRREDINHSALPPDAVSLVRDIFSGVIESKNSFRGLLKVPSITVGAPIFDNNGEVFAAVLLHTEADGVAAAIQSGLRILFISLLFALVIAIFVSIILSKRFISPLQLMESTTQKLVNGDYNVQTNVVQNDEIGSLAAHIDTLALQLEKASNQSNELEQMRKDFIANISHELRTPVTVMRGSLDALCDGVVTDKKLIKEYYEQMQAESIHLERMINDLLDLSRLQNTGYSIEKSRLQLHEVIQDASRSMKQIANEKNIRIVFDNQLTESPYHGDYGRLRQMFMIVLNNAVKFSNHNQTVELSLVKRDSLYIFTVTDTGKGILSKDIPHIFERFYKDTDEINQKGIGLGLAIAKEIADRHQIIIEVTSEINQETSFTFYIQYSSIIKYSFVVVQ